VSGDKEVRRLVQENKRLKVHSKRVSLFGFFLKNVFFSNQDQFREANDRAEEKSKKLAALQAKVKQLEKVVPKVFGKAEKKKKKK
jgi:hypothetical protein